MNFGIDPAVMEFVQFIHGFGIAMVGFLILLVGIAIGGCRG